MLVQYRLIPIHAQTWSDMPPSKSVRGVTSASITKSASDGSSLMDSATITVHADLGYEFPDGWYRLEALFPEELQVMPLMTMWAYATGDLVKGQHVEISVTGTSVIAPLDERQILTGDYLAKDSTATNKIKTLLEEALPCPVIIHGSFTLNDYYVFDPGTKYISVIWGLLKKAGWCMQVWEDGSVHILEKPKTPSALFDLSYRHRLVPNIQRSFDRHGIPNRLKVIDRYGQEYTVTNERAESKTSYQARGRWIDAVDNAPQPKDGETLPAYSRRQMEELSTWAKMYTLDLTQPIPDIHLFDMVRVAMGNEGVTGDLRVIQQTISCGTHLKATWQLGEEIKEYLAWPINQSIKEQS